MSATPLRVLIAGGGIAAAEAALALRALARDRVTIDLLAPGDELVEKPLAVLTPFTGTPAPRMALDRLPVHRRVGALAAVDADAREVRTTGGARFGYDRLIVATGARSVDAVPGATLFRGPLSGGRVEAVLRAARSRVVFVAPPGCGWPLPLYELALFTAATFPDGPEVTIVSPEPRPLDIFGRMASDAVARLFDRAGIDFMANTAGVEALDRVLVTEDGRMVPADAVIALPTLRGPAIDGLAQDPHGFLAVDEHCRVAGAPEIFAVGDITAGPIKQGGLAAQQADAAAELIAAEAGAPIAPRPCRRILRGVVLTGEAPLYLRRDLDDDEGVVRPLHDVTRAVSRAQLWWPSGKVAGRYLTGFLAAGGRPGDPLLDRPPRRPLGAH